MNKKELNEAFFKLHASDDLIKEVLTVERESKSKVNGWIIARRVAACAAVLTVLIGAMLWPKQMEPGEQMGAQITQLPTAPTQREIIATTGVLKLYACANENVAEEDFFKYELTDGVSSYRAYWVENSDVAGFGIPLNFEIPKDYYGEADVTFELHSEFGYFLKSYEEPSPLGKEVTIVSGDQVFWNGGDTREIVEAVGSLGVIYLYVVIYVNDQAAGYGVIEVGCQDRENLPFTCFAYKFTTVCFPLLDGQLQDVSEDYIWEQIEELTQANADLKGV